LNVKATRYIAANPIQAFGKRDAPALGLVAIAVVTYCGWLFNLPLLRTFWPTGLPLNPLTSASLLGTGLAMLFLRRRSHSCRTAALTIGIVLVGFAVFRILDATLRWNLFDQWFPAPEPGQKGAFGLGTAALGIGGFALVALARQWSRAAQVAAVAVGAIALFALAGYAFYMIGGGVDPIVPLSIPGTLSICLISVGILLLDEGTEFSEALRSNATSGLFARLLIPAALLLPLAIGLIARSSENASLIQPSAGPSLEVALTGLLLAALTWLAVVQQRRKEIEADQLTRALEQNVLHLRLLHAVTSDPHMSFREKAVSLLHQIRLTLGADCAILASLDKEVLGAELFSYVGSSDLGGTAWDASIPAFAQALLRDGPVVFSNGLEGLGFEIDHNMVRAFLGERIVVDGRPFGVLAILNLARRPKPFAPDDLDQLRLVARWFEFELNSESSARALRDSEKQFKNLAATMPGMVFQLEQDQGESKFSYVSEGIQDVFGLSPAQLLADGDLLQSMTDPGDYSPNERTLLRDKERTLSLYHRTRRYFLPAGEVRWVETYAQPQRLEDGRVIWTGISIDVTGQRKLESELDETRDRLSAILSSVEDVIFSLTLDSSRTIFVSDAANRVLGYPPSQYLEDPDRFYKSVHPEDQAALEVGFRNIDEHNSLDIEVRYLHPNGRTCWLRVRAHIAFSEEGKPLRIDGITTDVTQRKHSEFELDQARAEAVQANAAKSEFLSRMSHELRTPMNAILGFAQLLEIERLTDRQSESVQHILRAGRHLLELVNEVLDIARIESGTLALSLEPVELSRLVSECVALVRPLANARSITFERETGIDPELHVLADRQRLRQVFLNLLSNAIKYSPVGGTVTVREASRQGKAVVEVEDKGNGLTPGQIERLFIPFDRLGAETSGIEGTGLGLPLAKRLLESMGGALGLRSIPGQGSLFWAELQQTESNASAVQVEEPHEAKPLDYGKSIREVLLIEDNLSNVRLIEEIVYTIPKTSIISAMQGRLGLALAREHPPSVILLDMNLPDVHGLELLSQIRAEKALVNIPVIVLSADATDRQVERALEGGATSYLTKPFNVREFMAVLNKHLDRRPLDD
jgi:PAS domain S-box-containing protein